MRRLLRKSVQRYCFFLIYANIFEKKCFFRGKRCVFLFFWGVAVMGLEGIETIKTIEAIVWHFFFLQAGAQVSSKGHCFFAAFSFVLLPSFCRPFAVFLPSFYRLCFEIESYWYWARDYEKNHRNCYVKIKKTNFICVFQINVVSLRAFRQMIVNSMYCETK